MGFGWAIIGVGNVLTAPPTVSHSFLLLFNAILFVLPGLVVGAIGTMMCKKS
jgi:hypothetical protein